jgi:dihydroxyacetone kinase-like protein
MTAVVAVLLAVAADVAAARDELNRLDAVAGDGDLGATMATAAATLQEVLPTLEDEPLAALCRRCGSELARKAPSTAGTLFATGFLRAGAAAAEAPDDEANVALLARLLAAAQTGIETRGKAKPGDKTLLDALAPAASALAEAAARGDDLLTALDAAAAAAAEGARATMHMQATVGRAGWLAERSAGHEDGGARVVALALESAARHARFPGAS